MTRINQGAAAVYAAADLAVVLAPALVLSLTARKGGIAPNHGLDLLLASTVIGGVHAVVAYRRLVDEERAAIRRADVWLAALDALVVLALGATLLLVAVLGGFAQQHAVLVNRGWPVVGLWILAQIAAVVVAEIAGRTTFRWLERAPAP